MFEKLKFKVTKLLAKTAWFWSILLFVSIIIFNNQTVNSQSEPLDVAQLGEEIDKIEAKWERDYEAHFQRDFVNYNRSAPEIAAQLDRINQEVGIKPAVIWAIPKPEFLELVLITPSNRVFLEKIRSADDKTLDSTIELFLTAIADRQSTRYLPPAKLLYQWIFGSVEQHLQAEQIDTILLCTGPKLRSLPFAALHDGEKFAIEKYNLTRIPAFNLTDVGFQKRDNRRILAMGASKFTNKPDLPGVAVELNAITPNLFPGEKILDQEFTIEKLIAKHQQNKFDIVHLATHSEFLPGSPDKSYIQFSDRALLLNKVTQLNLDKPQVDLLVLSSCKTALGDKDAEFGFAGLAMQIGVKSVLGSLWSINDAGTVALMSEFYQHLKRNPIKAEALTQAQLAMLRGEVSQTASQLRSSNFTIPLPPALANLPQQDLTHPFYWAGFTIIGNPF
jgi:CHAT domain-containing protein